ncbi:MAG: M48 family metallopeptidase, partial [Pyrinomonadaceae bacterium]
MKQNKPARALVTFFATFVLLLSSFTVANAQKTRERQQIPDIGSTTGAVISLGSTILNTATGIFDDDPYAQFRNAKYSNEGLMTEQDEIKLGDDLHVEFSKKYKYVNTGQERATRIGRKVAQFSGRPSLPYKFYIFQDKDINAFAAPGGHVYITTGLMNLATDDELAAVLAHEIGHVVARHSLVTIQQRQAIDSLAGLVGSLTGIVGQDAGELGTLAAQLVASPLILAHDRDQEREADFLGVNTMSKAGYDPQGMITMFHKMAKISKTDSDLLGSIFSDHPDVPERVSNTEYEIKRIASSKRAN